MATVTLIRIAHSCVLIDFDGACVTERCTRHGEPNGIKEAVHARVTNLPWVHQQHNSQR